MIVYYNQVKTIIKYFDISFNIYIYLFHYIQLLYYYYIDVFINIRYMGSVRIM